MILDASNLPTNEELETEVCIIGSGPAGITLAREFIGQNFRVILLESGSLEVDEETESLYDGPSDEPRYPYHLRFRQLGGTANSWSIEIGKNELGVRYAPLDEIDFEKRDWLPYSGWPFQKNHLLPFYEKAHAVCQIGPFNYEAKAWENADSPQLEFQNNRITTTVFQFGPRDIFLKQYLEEIKQAPNITTYLKANVVNLETNETANIVSRVQVATLSGNQFCVKAKFFILAAGGIENARLLLLSDRTQKTGLGNQNDLVGRFFMDHFQILGGVLFPTSNKLFSQTALYDLRRVNDVAVMGKLSLTPNTMEREHLLNSGTYLIPRHKTYHLRRNALNSLNALVSAISEREITPDVLKHLNRMAIAGLGHTANIVHRKLTIGKPFYDAGIYKGGWADLSDKEQEFATFEIQHLIEQAPDPLNRVRLSDERDRLGCRKIKVERRLTEIDLDSLKRTQKLLQEEFAHSGFGQLRIEIENGKTNLRELPTAGLPGSSHHMGTTRMHTDPKQGVVDTNCQVHDTSNLFIAGSSVFPTGGYANPTLTIVALAIRLADHIKILMSV